MAERLVIIGGGMAATRLIEELLRVAPHRFEITLIGAEPRLPYNRVLLSSLLAQDVTEEEIELKSAAWWQAQGIKTYFGNEVKRIDRDNRTVVLANGKAIDFDRLVLATGSRAFRLPLPGTRLQGVLTFRDCGDVDLMRRSVAQGTQVAVIGGGLLGLEAAYGLAKAGANVTVVHVMDRLMERQLDAAAAELLKKQLEDRGISILLNARTSAILGDTGVNGLQFDDGQILPADLVVMAVGISPNVNLAQESGILARRGIVVDDQLRTSDADVFALGECAEHRGIVYGLVEPAYEQAHVLARTLAGEAAGYEGSLTATNLKVSGVKVFSAGDFIGAEGTQCLIWRDRGLKLYRKLVLRETDAGSVLVGCVLTGETSDGLWYLELIRSAPPIGDMRADLIFGRALCERQAA